MSIVSKLSKLKGTKAVKAGESVVENLKQAKRTTFNTINEHPTSLPNAWTSKVNSKIEAGNTQIIPGYLERRRPGADTMFTGVGITKKADKTLGAAMLVGASGYGLFKTTDTYENFEKMKAAEDGEVNSSAPHTELGTYDHGTTDAVGIGYGTPSVNRTYSHSRDYTLGATGALTLGLHKARRRY